MKRLILAATLAIAVPAFAQDAAAPAGDATTPAATPTDTATPPADSAAPTATTPAAPEPTAAAPAAASTDLPVCSAKITDRCIEKGSAPRKAWKKKKK
jgi:hypothetical protein